MSGWESCSEKVAAACLPWSDGRAEACTAAQGAATGHQMHPRCHVHSIYNHFKKQLVSSLHLGGAKLLLSFSPRMQVWRGTFWIQQRTAPRSFPETAE